MGMILSSADILRVLGGDAIVRQEARVEVVKDRPGLGTDDTVYVYIEKYPTIEEFEAVWRIWILDNSGMGQYVLNALASLLPSFEFNGDHYTVREFASERTVVKSQAEKDHEELQKERAELRTELSGLQAGVEDRLKAVRDGVDGKDGKDGRDGRDGVDGRDGRDGRDLEATEVDLFDLADVQRGIALQRGQVLTWDGKDWTNLFVPQLQAITFGGGGGDGENVIISDTAPETREDGSSLQAGDQWWESDSGILYIYYTDDDSSQWVQSSGGSGSGGGSSTLAGLLDTDTNGAEDGDILVYRSATGNWTAETASLGGGDVESVNGQTGVVVLTADDVGALESGDNVSELVNDAGYITLADVPDDAPVDSVNGQTGVVVLDADDIDDTSTVHKFATAAQLSLADTSVQPGDSISELTNDAGYITLAEVPAAPVDSVNGQTGTVVLTADDVGALEPGDNISDLNNDVGYITDAGVTQIVAGANVTVDPVNGTGVVTINASSSGIPEAPLDGNYYVRASSSWVKLTDALSALGVVFTDPVDAGNFTTGLGTAITNSFYDGGNFTDGTSTAIDNDIIDGGLTTP